MSKKPKTPDVAAVWHEVKGISNGLAALRITVAVDGNRTTSHAKLFNDAFDRIRALENTSIDAQGIGEQIGDLEVRVGNLEPLHAAVSMLEAKVAELTQPRSESQRMRTLSAEDSVAVLVKMNTDLCRISQLDANRVCVLNRECGTVRSVVTVLVIVQAFTLIAGLAWVLGVGR